MPPGINIFANLDQDPYARFELYDPLTMPPPPEGDYMTFGLAIRTEDEYGFSTSLFGATAPVSDFVLYPGDAEPTYVSDIQVFGTAIEVFFALVPPKADDEDQRMFLAPVAEGMRLLLEELKSAEVYNIFMASDLYYGLIQTITDIT